MGRALMLSLGSQGMKPKISVPVPGPYSPAVGVPKLPVSMASRKPAFVPA